MYSTSHVHYSVEEYTYITVQYMLFFVQYSATVQFNDRHSLNILKCATKPIRKNTKLLKVFKD